MRNAINAERSKGTEQVKIMEQEMEQMEITMNPHGSIMCGIHGTDKFNITCMLAIILRFLTLNAHQAWLLSRHASTGNTSETLKNAEAF